MNPPVTFPLSFDLAQWNLNKYAAGSIPAVTADNTDSHYFSRSFSLCDIEWAMRHIKKHTPNSACGEDDVSYNEVLHIPNEDLLILFQECVNLKDTPDAWLTTLIIGFQKKGKPADNPESYRLIALESCLLKVLTLLIAKRIRDWMEEQKLLPATQNGFREGYRTNNNAYILRCTIDKAHSMSKTLFVGFVD